MEKEAQSGTENTVRFRTASKRIKKKKRERDTRKKTDKVDFPISFSKAGRLDPAIC